MYFTDLHPPGAFLGGGGGRKEIGGGGEISSSEGDEVLAVTTTFSISSFSARLWVLFPLPLPPSCSRPYSAFRNPYFSHQLTPSSLFFCFLYFQILNVFGCSGLILFLTVQAVFVCALKMRNEKYLPLI
jgi:hypothetical protein